MVTGARGREHFDRPPKESGRKVRESGRKVRDLKSIGKLLNPSVAANDAVVQSSQAKPLKKKVVKTASAETVTAPQTSLPSTAVNLSFAEPSRRKSGKQSAVNKAVVAGEEKKDCGVCLECNQPVEASCGTWRVVEKDASGKGVEVDRYTCSIECESKRKAQPRLLGNPEIKWKKVTSFG